MLGNFADVVLCEFCRGTLEADTEATIDDYNIIMNTNHTNIFDNIDKLLCRYIVYRCTSCDTKVKYTYKTMEKAFRRTLTEKFLMLIGKGELNSMPALRDKYFIYCGKCNGFNGVGCCPKTVYDKCEIKRFPVNEL
jgi:hypothetical protein